MAQQAVQDPNYEQRVRDSFARQQFMTTLGATLGRVAPGEVLIAVPFSAPLTQQHGFLHAGVVAAVIDSACGYAALTLMEPGVGVMSVEFKVNLLQPAVGNGEAADLPSGQPVRGHRPRGACGAHDHRVPGRTACSAGRR